ncbi:MAG: 2-phosphosulfolactate phosphatase [Acidimicrobiales bacterium]
MGSGRCSFAWGPAGALDLVTRESCSLVAVVDVLSFSTTVSVATARGIAIIPARPDLARQIASDRGVPLASEARSGTPESPWSLAPSRMMTAPVVPEVVLPSPNGSAIVATATDSPIPVRVVAACLRNRTAAATWLAAAAAEGREIAVVAAGERWPDGTLRPAVEDLLGAAALILALGDLGVEMSPEAALTARCAAGLSPVDLGDLVRQSMSALELRERGYGEDVGIATEVDVSAGTPVLLASGAFVEEAGPGVSSGQKPGKS